jgi:hypothetical protein
VADTNGTCRRAVSDLVNALRHHDAPLREIAALSACLLTVIDLGERQQAQYLVRFMAAFFCQSFGEQCP